MDIRPIQEAVQLYFEIHLAPSTHQCYNAGRQHYLQFCTQANITLSSTSENTLMLFAAYLAQSGLAYKFTSPLLKIGIHHAHSTLHIRKHA